jgi:hypothetical protein
MIILLQLSAKVGVGIHYDKKKQLGYTLRGKKSFSLTSNDLVGINVKGLLLTGQEYNVVSLFPVLIYSSSYEKKCCVMPFKPKNYNSAHANEKCVNLPCKIWALHISSEILELPLPIGNAGEFGKFFDSF